MPSGTAISVGTNSWVTEAEADTYFATRFGSSEYWLSGTDKEGAIITAYGWLMGCGKFALAASATAAQVLKDAQCEMALFLVQHQPDIDLRMGLQAQGGREAGIVKEKYGAKMGFPIPPFVLALLDSYRNDSPVHMVDVERNENRTVGYDAPGNLFTDIAEEEYL